MAQTLLVHIICPECESTFEVDKVLLGSEGRYVVCSECQHQWFQCHPSPDEEDPLRAVINHNYKPNDNPPLTSLESEEETTPQKASFFAKQFFLIPVLLSLIFTGLFFGRNDIIRFIPGMDKFYNALGISAYNISAFRFHNTQWQVINSGAYRSIQVTGSVTNTSNKLLVPPHIQVTLWGRGVCQNSSWIDQLLGLEQNKNGTCRIGKWIINLKEGRLFSGQTSSFSASYVLTPTQLPTEVLLKFVKKNQ